MRLSSRLALVAGKASFRALRLFGRGGGALPGLIALRLGKHLLSDLASQCPEGVVLVCGTNGKTTTCRLLAAALEASGKRIVHNRSGSNLLRGHLAAFVEATSWSGRVDADLALLEVDEAILPHLLALVSPRLIVLHNLFRDQLDRYGEVDGIARRWLASLHATLPQTCRLLVNGDDPHLAYLGKQRRHPLTAYYGLDDPSVSTDQVIGASDSYLSPASHTPLHYVSYYVSHLGDYADTDGGFSRPPLDWKAENIDLHPTEGSRFLLSGPDGKKHRLSLALPGLYNVYNALAAASAALEIGLPASSVVKSFASLKSAFGRFEKLNVGSKELVLCLIKNPAGAAEILRTLNLDEDPLRIVFLVNDNFADGQDVSWYWDTPYELIAPSLTEASAAGTRAADLAVRLKYAGFAGEIRLMETVDQALEAILSRPESCRFYFLSTYTATLELQRCLERRSLKAHFWRE